MQNAQQQPQAAPAQGLQQAGWPGMAVAMYQQGGMPTAAAPGALGFGSMPMAMMNCGPMNSMLAMRMAPGIAGGQGGSPAADGLVYSLPQQDARFHFSEAAFANAGALGAPTNDDLLTAFMPGCDDAGGGGSSGSAGLFGSAGIFAGLSSLGAPSTGGSSQRAGTLPLRPSPLSKCSSGGSGDNAPGSNGGSGSGCASRPPPQRQPPSNSVSSTLPISALMFPAGSMHSDSSMPLGPMLRAPPVQQAAAQQEQTSQRRPGDAPAGPLLTVQQAQQDMQRFLNAEPAQQVGRGTGTGAGASNNAAAAAPRQQKPQSAFTGYSQPAPKPQGSGQLQPPARLTAQPSMQSAGTTQQGPWAMAPQQQWASAQWGAGPQQALAMRQQQAIGAAFGQQGVMPQQAPGQQPQGPAPSGAPFGVAPPQQAAAGQQTSGQPQPQSTQQQQQQPPTAAPGQPALPPGLSQQQQMAMLQWQQMQLQQMQAAFAMQQQALASGQQLPFAGAPGMGPFGNPYMAQFPMSGGMWPPQLSGAQLMMMQQQAQQASMQQQAMQQAQAAQQQAQAQQQQAPPQQQCTSQPLSQGHPPQQQQQQPQQTACCGPAAVQALLQPGLASAHSSGTQAALQQQQSQQQQQQAAAASHPQRAPSSCLTNGAAPMSGVVQGAQRTVSNATNLTLSDAGVAHIKWEYGGSSAAPQGPGSDPGSAGRSSGGAAVVPELGSGEMRLGSAGSGQLGVQQVPASALLAGALMPSPYPAGGVPMTRAERVDRYREKKARRTDGGAVRYIARQQNAHRRPRIKGRFVKAEELAEYLASNPGVTITGANKLLGLPEDGETYTSTQTDAGDDSTAVALSAPAQQAHVVPTASAVSNIDCSSTPPAATA